MSSFNGQPQFCPECSKIMVPLNFENDLYFVCRDSNCGKQIQVEDKENFCVYTKSYSVVQKTSQQNEVKHDPTYPKVKKECVNCSRETEQVYYYSSHWAYNCSLQINYICSVCGTHTIEGGGSI